MKENFTNIKNDPLVAAAAKILIGCTQLDETVELQEMSNTKIAKDIKKGDSFKANLKIPGKGVDISKAYTVIATDDAMDSKTHPGKLVNIRVKAGNYTTVVPFEKNQKVDLVEETIEEKVSGFSHPEVTRNMLDIIDEFDAGDVEALLKYMIDSFTYPHDEDEDVDLLLKNLKRTLHDWKNRSGD